MAKAMREPTFWILTALVDQARHGYGIIREVDELSAATVHLQPGTLYAALDRLTAEGLIEADHEETVDGRPRRYYRLTDPGATALATESTRLARNAATATTRLRTRPNLALNLTAPA